MLHTPYERGHAHGTTTATILVVGAGASGLAFALTCAVAGHRVRIIEKRPQRLLDPDKRCGG